jgi:hypothetical protein
MARKQQLFQGGSMLRFSAIAAASLLLSGCLTTSEPVFDDGNSTALAEMPEFLAFVDTWERFVGEKDSPRELAENGGRGIMVDGLIVVQERSDYYAFAIVGGRPLGCVIYADDTIEEVAKGHGVTVEVDRSRQDQADILVPVQVDADGPPEALVAFIKDQFANQALACNMQKRGEINLR